MGFEQWISIGSLVISVLAIIFSHLNVRLQFKYNIKADKRHVREEERKKVAQFLGYCKKAYTFGITESEMISFFALYIEIQAIESEDMRQAVTKCCNSVITKSDTLFDDFANCVSIYKERYKSDF